LVWTVGVTAHRPPKGDAKGRKTKTNATRRSSCIPKKGENSRTTKKGKKKEGGPFPKFGTRVPNKILGKRFPVEKNEWVEQGIAKHIYKWMKKNTTARMEMRTI